MPGILFFIIFCYVPMFGIIMAFQNYTGAKGFLHSPWVGMGQFVKFFSSLNAWPIIRNTLLLNIYGLIWGFPIPIIFAVALCEVRNLFVRKFIQTASYLPYFISTVISVGLLYIFVNVNNGLINNVIAGFGGEKINFLITPKYFRTMYIILGIWRGFGWTAIIYMAAILGIDPQLYESAAMDGAKKLRQIWSITIPCISGTIIVMLLLNIGSMMSIGFEQVYLMYTPTTYAVSDVLSTFIYRVGILGQNGLPQYSYSTAVGLFQSVVNVILLFSANTLSKRIAEKGLF